MEYLLLLCPWAEMVWFGEPLGYRVDRGSITTLHDWLEGFLTLNHGITKDSKKYMSIIAFTCWHIWKARCNAVFNNKLPFPPQTLQALNGPLTFFWAARSRLPPPLPLLNMPLHPLSHWTSPPSNLLKINVDASWKPGLLGGPNSGFAGIIVRNSASCCLAVHQREIRASNLCSAKASAVLEGYLLALQEGFFKNHHQIRLVGGDLCLQRED